MADDEKKAPGYEMGFWAKVSIGILILLILFPFAFSGKGAFSVLTSDESEINNTEDSSFDFSISGLIGQGKLAPGKIITSLKDVPVRRIPGGQILGVQKRLTDGKIIEGPVNRFETNWYRVNFEKAPSGWVESDGISARTKLAKFIYFPTTFYKAYKPIGWILTVLLLIIVFIIKGAISREQKIAFNKMKVQDEQVEKKKDEIKSEFRDELGLPVVEDKFKNQRWEHVEELMKSKSQSDWRQAIIEADIILDEMLRRMSYDGLTIGDMLKKVDPADFATLDKAWEAHKFRNEIAHTGSEFKLSKEEAERTIDLFRSVFDEFYYI